MKRLPKDQEIKQQLISSSKKLIFGRFFPHFHDFFEIEYIIGGSGSYSINDQKSQCAEGMLFFITPVDYHSVETEGAEIFNIMFSEQLVNFKRIEPFLRPSTPKTITIEPKYRPFFEMLFHEIVENQKNISYCSALMDCLLLKLEQLIPTIPNDKQSDVFSKIHLYVINNYRKNITLKTVADSVGFTPGYISALFKKEMGIGFKEYLIALKLDYAKKLLLYTQQSVKQICYESGFEDIPNFIRRFKAYYGITPLTMRKSKADNTPAESL